MAWLIVVTWLARLILLALVVMSVWALSIILERRQFYKLNSILMVKNKLFVLITNGKINDLADFKKSLSKSLFAQEILLLSDGEKGLRVRRQLFFSKEKYGLEGKTSLLGTFGSTSPFIGLLGTVFGIIVAFGELSAGKIDSNSVMYALAEALILTAVGLVVAIPSVMAFNYFNRRLKSEREVVETTIDYLKENEDGTEFN